MAEYEVKMSSKGQVVLPKKVRDQFKLCAGSKIRIIVDGENIVFKPRTIADEFQDLILADVIKDGKNINEKTVSEYKNKLNQALDHMVDEADREYDNHEYVSLEKLKQEDTNV